MHLAPARLARLLPWGWGYTMKKFSLVPAEQLASTEAPARTSLSEGAKAAQALLAASGPAWQGLSDVASDPENWRQEQDKACERMARQRAAEDEALERERARINKKLADIRKEKHLQVLRVMSGDQPDHICFDELVTRAASGLLGVKDAHKWRDSLEALIGAGLLVSGDQGFSREAVQEVLPLLKAEGLEPGPGLVHWLGLAEAGAGAGASFEPAKEVESRHATESKKRVPKWLSDALRDSSFWDSLERGIALSGGTFTTGRDCSANDVVGALQELGIVEAYKCTKTIADAIRVHARESGRDYAWTRKSSDKATAMEIVRLYRQGEAYLDKDRLEDAREEKRRQHSA